MRKVLLPLLATLVVATALFVAPALAAADTVCDRLGCNPTTMENNPNFRGWGAVSGQGCSRSDLASYCVTDYNQGTIYCFRAPCPQPDPVVSITAYRWANGRWTAVRIAPDPSMYSTYLYPYTSGWAWIWRRSTGWLAIRSNFAVTRIQQQPISIGDCRTGC